jgi:hypothetical protein
MLSRQQHDGFLLGDAGRQLKKVQQLRKLLDAQEDFPSTGSGLRHEQVTCTSQQAGFVICCSALTGTSPLHSILSEQ